MEKLWPLFLICCFSCMQRHGLEIVADLPSSLSENSACEVTGGRIWTTQDHGNAPILYALDLSGRLRHRVELPGVRNHDWEELASDASGNLYVGDFGNNGNDRKDLAIYRVDATRLSGPKAEVTSVTRFFYPEQADFPARKNARFYDCEAFFEYRGYFYLFTKNRSRNFDGTTSLYRIPNREGNFAAQQISQFKTCDRYGRCAVTAADISPDGTKVILLTAGALYVFSDFSGDDFLGGKTRTIPFEDFTQKEGAGFLDDDTVLITDERVKKTGGKLYRLKLSETEP